MKKNPKVVVLGGGYAGIRASLDILHKTKADVILVDEKPYHALPTQFYEAATIYQPERPLETKAEEKRRYHELLYSVAIPFHDIFKHSERVEIVKGRVQTVRPSKNEVLLTDGRRIDYNYLVLGIGSRTNYFDIPHLQENSFSLKSPEDALNIRDRVDELFRTSAKHKKISIVIGGGGVTGCELAAELVGYMKKLAKLHQHPVTNWSCVLIEAQDSILSNFSPLTQKHARRRLSKLGVTVITKSEIKDVWPNLLYIGDEKKTISFDLLVWAAGVRGRCEADIVEHTKLSEKSCMPVSDNLCVPSCDNVFAVGDVAATLDKETGEPGAMTAQKAIHDGKYAAYAISKKIKNKNTKLKKYTHKKFGYIIALGGKYALLDTQSLKLKGRKVWILKYIVLFNYLRTILPAHKAFSFVLRNMRLFTQND